MERNACKTLLCMVGLLVLCHGAGCLSTRRSPDALRISISKTGQVRARGKEASLPYLVELVQALGATSATRLEISLPPNANARLVYQATTMLRRAGYGKTVFITAKNAESYTAEQMRRTETPRGPR